VNPTKKLIAAGATFIARTNSHQPNHVMEMMDQAIDHDGFSVIHCLSECAQFYPGAFDKAHPRKGGIFDLVPAHHDVTDEVAAYRLALAPFPGFFGVFYKTAVPTKNALEAKLIADAREKSGNATPVELMTKTLRQFC
jgi:2-oxoglutarate ferredoxin oxidoreductase subunit beta